MLARTTRAGLARLCSRAIAIAGFAAASSFAARCAADEPPPLAGRLYLGVYLKTDPAYKFRCIVVVDMATGRYEKTGAEGLNPRVSPDGKQVAYYSYASGKREAWVKRLGQNDEPRLVSNGRVVGWLDGGTELIVQTERRAEDGSRWLYENYRMNASGANRRDLKLPPEAHVLDCTPDGIWLLVEGLKRRQNHLVPTDGSEPIRLTLPSSAYRGRFSPDGRQIALITRGRQEKVVVVDSDGSNLRFVYEPQGRAEARYVCWSPDGQHLAVEMFDWAVVNGRYTRGGAGNHDYNFRVLIIDKDGKNPRPLVLEGLPVEEISGLDWK